METKYNHLKRIQENEDMLRQLELVSRASVYVEMETLRREAQMKLFDSVREELK